MQKGIEDKPFGWPWYIDLMILFAVGLLAWKIRGMDPGEDTLVVTIAALGMVASFITVSLVVIKWLARL